VSPGRLPDQPGIAAERGIEVARGIGPHLVQRLAGAPQRALLMRQHRQLLCAHPAYIGRRPRIAFDRPGLIRLAADRGAGTIRGRCLLGRGSRLRPEAREHVPGLIADLVDDFPRPLGPAYLPPLGEAARPVLVGRHGIVAGHVLGAVARQDAGELALIGEVVAAVVELHPVAVPRHAHIGAVPVHAGVARTWARSTVTPCDLWKVAA
jgi:hypothetical protein